MSAIASKDLQDIDVLLEKVASATGLSTQAISEQLESANISAFRFNDMILVAPDDFDTIIDGWAESIKVKLAIKPSAAEPNSSIGTADQQDSVDDQPASNTALTWPQGFENVVTHLYTPTLKKILPEDKTQKRRFLKAIATETPDGERLADELVKAIIKRSKRNLSPEKVMAGLKAKCSAML